MLYLLEIYLILFHNFRSPLYKGQPIRVFPPIKRSKKPYQFNFVDVKNDGFTLGVAPHANRMEVLDAMYKKVEILVNKNGDTSKKTPIQQQCEAGIQLKKSN